MKAKDWTYLITVQVFSVLCVIAGVCIEVQALINIYNWQEVSQKLGVASFLAGTLSLLLAGVMLIAYGWVIGMLSVYWKREQR